MRFSRENRFTLFLELLYLRIAFSFSATEAARSA